MANTFKFGNGNWAVKDGYALAYNDENNNFKPLPFDFTRASSATRVNKQGLIETVPSGKPRIDFLDNTSGHLLLEPSRTNIITNSEQFVDAPTGNTNMDLFSGTITNNNTTSPDGNTKGMKYTISSGSGAKLRIYQSDLSTSADTTFSIYAKSGTTNSLSIAISGGTTKSVTTTNEWQRITTTDTSNSSKFIDVDVSGSVGQYIYIFGMQAEAASYATSYIPTEGSSVTRVAEQGIDGGAGTAIFSNTTAVWFLDIERLGVDAGSSGSAIALRNSSFSQQIRLHFDSPTEQIRLRDALNGFATISTITGMGANVRKKIALRINGSALSTFSQGSKIGSDYTAPSTFDIAEIDFSALGFKIHDMKFYNTALTDTELQNLTS